MALFDNQTNTTHTTTITSKINQLSKGQDYIYMDDIVDVTGEKCKIAVVFDGHGENKVIDFIRSIPNEKMNQLLMVSKPVESLANYINENLLQSKIESSGSTMCMVKLFSNRIECINCGDSQVAIYKNGSLEYMSQEHNYENEKERERLKYDVTFIPASNIKMIDADTLINVYSEYIEWEFPGLYTKLACTQALGHNSITGYDPEYKVIQLTENDKFKVIIGSDGLWEMIMKDDIQDVNNLYNMDANAIVEQTTNRWLQMWNMHDVLNNKKNVQGKFTPQQCDDIAVFIADILPNEINEMANEKENGV